MYNTYFSPKIRFFLTFQTYFCIYRKMVKVPHFKEKIYVWTFIAFRGGNFSFYCDGLFENKQKRTVS